MASKLELRFKNIDPSIPKEDPEVITLAGGMDYVFLANRLGYRQVAIGEPRLKPDEIARNFYNAFQVDDNYAGTFTTSYLVTLQNADGTDIVGDPHGIVTIEHPDNNFFAAHSNTTSFITSTITTTTQVEDPTVSVSFGAAANACGNYKLILDTNKTEGNIYVEFPIGTDVHEITLDGSPSYEVELTRPATAQTGIVKYFSGLRTSRGAAEVLFNPPPVLSIQTVEVEGSPFGAFATIKATSGLVLEYSLNGTDWSGSPEFGGLLDGNFTAYARDLYGCQKTKSFVVTEDQVSGLTVPPYFEIAKHNAMHFVDRSHNNFLGKIAEEMNVKYCQDWLQEDRVPIQFKSSYKMDGHRATIYGCGSQQDITILKKSDNINRINIYEGNYTEKEGRLAVYFTSGNIYNKDETPKAEGHVLNGRLPLWYEAGVYLKIEGVGVTKISRLLEDGNTTYAITELTPATATNKKITSIHSEHPYEIYEFEVDGATLEGQYIIELDFGGDKPYWSEVQRFNESLPGSYYKVKWWNSEQNDQLFYATGIKPFRRIKYDRNFTFVGENERETHQTDTSIKLIRSKSKAVYELDFRPSTMEVARGLIQGLNHADHIDINGAVFICNSSAKPENFGDWYFVKTELALIGQSVESIEADLTQINVQFLKVVDSVNGVGFLQV